MCVFDILPLSAERRPARLGISTWRKASNPVITITYRLFFYGSGVLDNSRNFAIFENEMERAVCIKHFKRKRKDG